jgi:hypothetical protein
MINDVLLVPAAIRGSFCYGVAACTCDEISHLNKWMEPAILEH